MPPWHFHRQQPELNSDISYGIPSVPLKLVSHDQWPCDAQPHVVLLNKFCRPLDYIVTPTNSFQFEFFGGFFLGGITLIVTHSKSCSQDVHRCTEPSSVTARTRVARFCTLEQMSTCADWDCKAISLLLNHRSLSERLIL